MHEGVKLSSRTASHVRLALGTAADTAPRSPHAASLLRPETGPQICSSAPIPENSGAGVCVELHGGGGSDQTSGAANPHHSEPSRTRTTTTT